MVILLQPMLTGVLAVLAVGAFLAGGRRRGQLEQRQYLVDEVKEAIFIIRDFQPGGGEMEVYFFGGGNPGGMRGFHEQAQPGDGVQAEFARGGVLEGIGIRVQLTAVEWDLSWFGLGGLEIDDAVRSIIEADHRIHLAAQETAQGMTGHHDGDRLDPLLGNADHPGRQGRSNFGGWAAGIVGFHQAVDSAENRREGGGRPHDAEDVFEVKTARAFIPQEGQVGWAELDGIR